MPTLIRVPISSTSLNDSSTVFSEGQEGNEKRKPGRSERQYNETYRSYVSSIFRSYQQGSSQKRIPDYRSMTPQDKKQEQNKVDVLLNRLRISAPRPPHERVTAGLDRSCERDNTTNSSRDSSVTTLRTSFDRCRKSLGVQDRQGNSTFENSEAQSPDTIANRADQTSIALLSPYPGQPDPSPLNRTEKSMVLLSPQVGRASSSPFDNSNIETSMALLSPQTSGRFVYEDAGIPSQDCHNSSTKIHARGEEKDESSIELTRRNDESMLSPKLFDSPVNDKSGQVRQKRLASTSGKRGTDLSRIRTNDDSFAFLEQSCGASSEMIDSPSPLMCSSIPSLSAESCREAKQPLFSASQSPILHDSDASSDDSGKAFDTQRRSPILPDSDTSSDDSNRRVGTARRSPLRERTNYRGTDGDETVETVDCTILQKRRVRWNVGMDESYYDEPNISLKDGALFRMKPLRVRQHQKRRERSGLGSFEHSHHAAPLSFPDPLSSYRGGVMDRLNTIFQWLSDREVAWDNAHSCGVVVSFSMKQIISVTLKLLLESRQRKERPSQTGDGESVSGGTVIIVRDKEDLQLWESALREGTSHSVLNHAAMPVKERQRTATTRVCAGFDVVVTTFDAFKSKDIATPVDENGHAHTHRVGYEDGWYSSRSQGSSPNRCESLTVLHQMIWKRIIFVDVLGRKSYLSKPGTARVAAGIALNGSPRFVFFCKSSENTNPVEEIAKHDRKAIRSIAGVLRLSQEHAEEQVLDALIDMNES